MLSLCAITQLCLVGEIRKDLCTYLYVDILMSGQQYEMVEREELGSE